MNIIIYNPQNIGILEDFKNSNNFVFIEFEQKTENQIIREDDIWFNAICEKINDFNFNRQVSCIIIPNDLCNSIHRLEIHLRLHNWNKDKEYMKEIPIFFIEIQNLDNLGETEDKQLYDSEKSKIECTNPESFIKNIDEIIKSKITDYKIKDYKNISIQKPDNLDRHSYANEWGVVELAQADEFCLEFKLPPHLNLKHKIFKEKIQLIEKNNEKQKYGNCKISNPKILLVDDYCEKGWTESICKILNRNVLDKDNQLKITDIQTAKSEDEFNKIFKNQFFNLVFLDLRLPKNGTDNVPNIEVGLKILEKIKENPSIPVIILTASNKAWNMETMFEKGADGYFIKSSPDESFNLPDSKEKVNKFIFRINNSIKKGIELKLFWDKIIEIENNGTLINNLIIKQRVLERLRMSFGILKLDYQQTEFDKLNFYYSNIELAYITLWSVLNEIQEDYYEKTNNREIISVIDNNGRIYTQHLCNKPKREYNITLPPYLKKWKIKNQSNIFIDYKITFKEDKNGKATKIRDGDTFFDLNYQEISCLNHNDLSIYKDVNGNHLYKNSINYKERLSFQIAFLLFFKNEFISKGEIFLPSLKNLNEIRNKLYLTHGESDFAFFSKTEQQKRKDGDININIQNINELLELIYFLLTGKKME